MPMVDIDWLSEHVRIPDDLTYEQLAKDLVHVGLEEEAIHRSSVVGPVVVGYVADAVVEPQKNGKTIRWCHVDVGERYNATDEHGTKVPRGIVCGAPNMAAGEKVVVTLPGAILPGGFQIQARRTYGHISNGMCASARELGLAEDSDGIILLDHYGLAPNVVASLKPGDDLMGVLHLNTPILEINITPDRGYAFSYRGVAREYHHSTGAPFTDPVKALNARVPDLAALAPGAPGDMEVRVQDDHPIPNVPSCDQYYARAVRGFDPKAPVPNLLRRRLARAGMRSISLPVDVTNYVMLDLGQPMHAYDLDKIAGPIVVRRARRGERLTTLDGKDRELNSEDLLITDSPGSNEGSRILGLAGVMGGLYGEVTDQTTNILLESAHFDPITVARTARRHKLPTEASRRFERGVDTRLQPAAAQMAADMLTRYGAGRASCHPVDVDRVAKPKLIHFKTSEVRRLTGLDCDINQISDVLTDIGCALGGGGNGEFLVAPPTWRPDLTEPCDLVEEVARLVGYDQIPVHVPSAPITADVGAGLTPTQRGRRVVAGTLAEYGLVETLSYPFVGDEDFRHFSYDPAAIAPVSVELANPLAGDRPYLRRSLLLTLATTVQRNLRRGLQDVQLYEIGHVFLWDPHAPAIPALPGGRRPSSEQLAALDAGLPRQPLHVAGILTGQAEHTGWLGEHRDVDWSDAVEATVRISERLGLGLKLVQPTPDQVPAQWHPGRAARVTLPDGTVVGMTGELHPRVSAALEFPEHAAAFELNLTAILAARNIKPLQAKPVSTYPPVRQDLAFIVPDTVTAGQLRSAICEAAGNALESIELFDVFTGSQIGEHSKSLAFSVTFRAPDRTLTAKDSDFLRQAIVAKAAGLGAQLRA